MRPAAGADRVGGWIGYFTRHPTAGNLVLAMMLLAGVWGATTLRAQFLPDVAIERIGVSVAWPGAGPEEVDRQIVAALEPVLLAVEGVVETRAVAREGLADIDLEFEPGWDMDRASGEVEAALDRVTTLPEAAERPRTRRMSWFDRVTDVVVHGPVSPEMLTRYALELQSRLFELGVTRTRIDGAPDPVIRVAVPEAMLARHDLTLAAVAEAARAAADAAPAGALSGGARLRAGEAARSAEAVGAIPVAPGAGGEPLRLREIAAVTVEGVEGGAAWFVGENPAVRLRVDRTAGGDAIEVQRAVEAAAASLEAELPQGVALDLTRTRSQAIIDRLDILLDNAAVGLALVLAFLFLFLSARTAFWVALGIPAAMAASLGLMAALGLSLNMISLFALILCLGIVVDDAIVVGEHADSLARRGAGPAEAAERAARRMLAPVFCASVTTVIAFLSLAVIGGRFGQMILAIPVVVSLVLIASLVESFVVLPGHMRHALGAKRARPWYDAPSRAVDRGFRIVRERGFKPFMRWTLRLRWPVLGGALGLLLASLALLYDGRVPWRFFDAPERGSVSANFALLPGASRADAEAMLAEMNRALAAIDATYAEAHGARPVEFALGVIGDNVGRPISGADGKDADLLGGLSVELIDPDLRPYSQRDFLAAWEAEIAPRPQLETLSLRGEWSGPSGEAVSAALSGGDLRTLKAASLYVQDRLRALGVSGLEDTLAYDADELVLTLTPLGERLGFTAAAVGRALRDRLTGVEAAEFPLGPRVATIEVSLPEAERTADYLERARLRAPSGDWVGLSEVVEARRVPGFSAIRREDGRIVLSLSGELTSNAPEAAAAVREALERDILPEARARFDVAARVAGLAEEEDAFLADAALGFALCMAGIFLALAWVFGSWTRPFAVLLVIPLGLIGALWGHYWMGAPLSMFSVVGLIGMAGIIVNDAIVLVTTIDEQADRRALTPAIVDAAAERLRPVFLTTATTVAGLAPLLLERSTQAQFLKPTVITLVFGLGFGMALVLAVTPALAAAQRDVALALASARRLARRGLRRRRAGSVVRPD